MDHTSEFFNNCKLAPGLFHTLILSTTKNKDVRNSFLYRTTQNAYGETQT